MTSYVLISVKTNRALPWITPSCGPALTPSSNRIGIGGLPGFKMKYIVRCKIHITIAQNVHSSAVFDWQLWVTVGVFLGLTHMCISVSRLVVYMPGLACRWFLCLSLVRSHRQCVRYVRTHVCRPLANCPSNLSVLLSLSHSTLVYLSVCVSLNCLNRSRRMHQFLKSTTRINVPPPSPSTQLSQGYKCKLLTYRDMAKYTYVMHVCLSLSVCVCVHMIDIAWKGECASLNGLVGHWSKIACFPVRGQQLCNWHSFSWPAPER